MKSLAKPSPALNRLLRCFKGYFDARNDLDFDVRTSKKDKTGVSDVMIEAFEWKSLRS
jgi:hypothetical protein